MQKHMQLSKKVVTAVIKTQATDKKVKVVKYLTAFGLDLIQSLGSWFRCDLLINQVVIIFCQAGKLSQLQSVTTLWPVSHYSHRETSVNNLPKLLHDIEMAGRRTHDLSILSPMP